jgi:FtsZ-interacting cell division protein YlmF
MNEKLKGILRFLGLMEDDFNGYDNPAAGRYSAEPAAEPAPRQDVPRLQPVRPATQVTRTPSISFLDANDEPLRARPVPPIGNGPRGLQTVDSELELDVFLPTSFNEANRVTNQLRASRAVVLNVVNAEPALRRRYLDFTSGTVTALDAKIEVLEKGLVYLVSPKNVQVTPEVRARLRANRYEAMS